jgi:hypothetical protein
MSNPNPSTRFPKGNRIAADSGNVAKKRIRKSKLRKTEEALRKLEPKSLENIELSVNGKEVDKEVLASSKWIITNIMAVGKAAAAEEEMINGTRLMLDQAERDEEEAEEAVPQTRFSLTVLPTKKDI